MIFIELETKTEKPRIHLLILLKLTLSNILMKNNYFSKQISEEGWSCSHFYKYLLCVWLINRTQLDCHMYLVQSVVLIEIH